jgi:dolichol-phosphate mannosyltransferase
MKLISVVIPAFNEEESIPHLVKRVEEIFNTIKYEYELIIVDDGSSDRTFEVIGEYSKSRPYLKGVRLSRNMGHQAALDCGLNHATGDAVISMDADLQHPPEIALEMIQKWEEGYDIVTTLKETYKKSSLMYRLFAGTFYYLFNKFSQIKLTPNGSDFRLMSKRSLKAILSMPEYHKFYRGMVHFIGFKSTTISFQVHDRVAGERKYTFRKSMKLASDGLFSFSDFALKVPLYFGIILVILLIIYFIVTFIGILFFEFDVEKGWTSVILLVFLSLGIQLFFMGTMGIYIGKIFFEVKRRPVYFVEEYVGEFKAKREMNRSGASSQ